MLISFPSHAVDSGAQTDTHKSFPFYTVLLLAIFLTGCSQQVQTGTIVTCKHCSIEIRNTVSVIKVPIWKAKDYRVTNEASYCDTCGPQQVYYHRITRCERCQKVYKRENAIATRREEKSDFTITSGYCTSQCDHLANTKEVKHTCVRCGQVHETFRTRDKTSRSSYRKGYCSTKCRRKARVDGAVDKASERTGDILGRIGKGLFDGARKHR